MANDQQYLTIPKRATAVVCGEHEVVVENSTAVNADRPGPEGDYCGVYVQFGPLELKLSSHEALALAAAITEAALFYRESKADALAQQVAA